MGKNTICNFFKKKLVFGFESGSGLIYIFSQVLHFTEPQSSGLSVLPALTGDPSSLVWAGGGRAGSQRRRRARPAGSDHVHAARDCRKAEGWRETERDRDTQRRRDTEVN